MQRLRALLSPAAKPAKPADAAVAPAADAAVAPAAGPPSPTSARALAVAGEVSRAVDVTSPAAVLSQEPGLGAAGSVSVDWDRPRQVMEGIGGSITWYGNWMMAHPNREAILDAVFNELKVSMVRVRNCYAQGIDAGGVGEQTSAQLMEETRQIIAAGRKRLSGRDEFRILLTSWSPPPAIKASGRLNGARTDLGQDPVMDTLGKNGYGQFRYKEFATYWLDSLRAYETRGVSPTWISIQNEPDWNTNFHPVCIFRPSEDFFYPGYYRAFDIVYDTLRAALERMPEMIGPESTGFDNYVTPPVNGAQDFQVSWYSGNPRVAAIANHLYDAGVTHDSPGFFERLAVTLKNARREADQTMTRRLFMTEYANLKNHLPGDPLIMARTIYETIVTAEACLYGHWDLVWGKGNEGTLLVMDNPFPGIDTTKTWGFVRTQSFYWFQHFSRFIRPGMQRIATKEKTPSLNGVLEMVFVSKVYDGSSTAILINTTGNWVQVQFNWLPNEVPGKARKVYYSTLVETFTYAGIFPQSAKIYLKPESITTLHSGDY